jgi:hypothetical protein
MFYLKKTNSSPEKIFHRIIFFGVKLPGDELSGRSIAWSLMRNYLGEKLSAVLFFLKEGKDEGFLDGLGVLLEC